jgi:cytidylate kinase
MSKTSKKKMNVFVCGLPGCGKSTLVDAIAKKFGTSAIHTSGILRELQSKAVKEIAAEKAKKNVGWWESKEAMKFMEQRSADSSFDKQLDALLLKLVDKGNAAFDSWTLPWLSNKGYKIWLVASPEVRARRMAERNNKPYKEALEVIRKREKLNIPHYRNLYGFEFGKDLSPFHLVLNTEDLSEKEVQEIVFAILRKEFKRRR